MQSTDYINRQIEAGTWREEVLPAQVVGLFRPLTSVAGFAGKEE